MMGAKSWQRHDMRYRPMDSQTVCALGKALARLHVYSQVLSGYMVVAPMFLLLLRHKVFARKKPAFLCCPWDFRLPMFPGTG